MSDENKKQIVERLTQKTVEQAAPELKKKWELLGTLLAVKVGDHASINLQPGAPSKGEMEKIVGQLIENGEADFPLADGKKQSISLRSIDSRLQELKKSGMLDDEQKRSLEAIGSVQDLVPQKKTFQKIAESADQAIEGQSGGGGGIMNFLAGLFTYLKSLIGSWFGGAPALSFSEAMAQSAAPRVGGAVRGNLEQLAAHDVAAARLLNRTGADGSSVTDGIVAGVEQGAYDKFGATAPPRKPEAAATAYDNVEVEKHGAMTRKQLAGIVRDRVLFPVDEKTGEKATLAATIEHSLNHSIETSSDWMVRTLGKSVLDVPKAAKGMEAIIADKTYEIVNDPNFTYKDKKLSEMSKEERAEAFAETIGAEILNRQKELGFDQPVTGTFGFKKTPNLAEKDAKTGKSGLDTLKDTIREGVMKNDDALFSGITLVARDETNQKIAANQKLSREAKAAVHPDLNGIPVADTTGKSGFASMPAGGVSPGASPVLS